MRLSKSIIQESSTKGQVLEFEPQALEREISQVAQAFYQREKENKSGFRLSHLVANQSGIADKERADIEERVEKVALEKIKDIQEPAYKEAYAIGLEEGTRKAFEENKVDIQDRLEKLDTLLSSFGSMKKDLIEQNELYFVKTIHTLATKLAVSHIQEHQETIISVIRQAVDHAQSEENVVVRLSQDDFNFVEKFRDQTKKEFEFMKKLKMEVGSEIRPGGCIVETNYGTIDATVEERIKKLWEVLASKIPKAVDPLVSKEEK
jgi:flagellar assembly protein FliH